MANWARLQRVRKRILKAQGGRCKYCGCTLSRDTATLDHVVPKCLGGSGLQTNLVVACKPCNAKKGCKPPHVWYAELMMEKAA